MVISLRLAGYVNWNNTVSMLCIAFFAQNCDAESATPKQHTYTHTQHAWTGHRALLRLAPPPKKLYHPTDWQMGQPADISDRLLFMFLGCLKRAGTLSDGHRPAEEEAPLTGEGRWASWGYRRATEGQGQTERWLMRVTVFVQYNCMSYRVAGSVEVYGRYRFIMS